MAHRRGIDVLGSATSELEGESEDVEVVDTQEGELMMSEQPGQLHVVKGESLSLLVYSFSATAPRDTLAFGPGPAGSPPLI